jgi:tetratricopeptide (TPR) repeat protein
MPYDLFISYSRRDNAEGRVTALVDQIRKDFAAFAARDLQVFFDQHAILGMSDWRLRILEGLRESRLLLACLSPSFIASPHCEWEFVEYLKFEIAHLHGLNGVAPIYFVPVPGWDDPGFDQRCAAWVADLRHRQHFDLRPWYQQGESALHEAEIARRMGELSQQIRETIQRGEQAAGSPGNVDAPNPNFVGRTEGLRKLRENFSRPGNVGVLTAVHGVGGLGKTALAVAYAYAYAHQYGGGRWQVRCAGQNDLRLALAELATPMGFDFSDDERKDPDLQLDRVRRELKERADAAEPHRCLLLLDNVDRPELLSPAFIARLNPGDWLHILATTRLGEHELSGSSADRTFLPVDELSPDEALTLIETYQPGKLFPSDAERDAAAEIVKLLGCFTLAVESAAVYLGQHPREVTCAGFLSRLKKEGLEGLDNAAGDPGVALLHGEKRLSATLRPTVERLTSPEKLALEFAALLPPDQVPLPWLRALVSGTYPEMARDAEPGYPDSWINLVRSLLSQRLLQATDVLDEQKQPRVVRVHRLLQELMLSDRSETELTALQPAVDALIRERDAALRKVTNWLEARWELEPLTALALLWDGREHRGAAWLLSQTGQRWHDLAEWNRAEPLMRRALAIDEKTYGPDHPNVAIHLNNLAQLLQATNRLAEAEPLMRRALAIDEKSYGPDHPDVARDLNNLARLLQDTNRLAESEPLMRRALAIDERSYGPDHPNVASALNNLAQLLQATNRLTEAEPLMRRALAIDEKSYGPDHPEVATDLNNLAQLLKATNRLAEAEPLMRRALAIDEKSYGPDHPNVASALNNLAQLLQATNRLTEAEPLMRRALAIDEKSYGPDHPNVAIRLNNLASLLYNTNRRPEAEPLMRRVVEIFLNFTRSTGHPHPHLQATVGNYKALLRAMGLTDRQIRARLREIAPEFFP